MTEYYKTVNDALKDLQTVELTEHEMLDAERTITKEEQQLTPEEEAEKLKEEEAAKAEAERAKKRAELEASRGQQSTAKKSNNNNKKTGNGGSGTSTVATEAGTVVRVGYENGTSFIINYNSYDIETVYNGEKISVEALNFVRVDK